MSQQKNSGYNAPLYKMFDRITPNYDLLNRILTMGMDQRWRIQAAQKCVDGSQGCIMDLCSGTGDLAEQMMNVSHGPINITLVDFSENMLKKAKSKLERLPEKHLVHCVNANAEYLPFTDGTFSAIGIGFAFRNLTYNQSRRTAYLAELLRVLKPGGKFVIIETSQPENRFLRKIYHYYLRHIVPFIGDRIFRSGGAYGYLGTSASNFYRPGEVVALLNQVGFREIRWSPLMFGLISLVEAIR